MLCGLPLDTEMSVVQMHNIASAESFSRVLQSAKRLKDMAYSDNPGSTKK